MKQFSAARKKLQSTLRKHVVNVMGTGAKPGTSPKMLKMWWTWTVR